MNLLIFTVVVFFSKKESEQRKGRYTYYEKREFLRHRLFSAFLLDLPKKNARSVSEALAESKRIGEERTNSACHLTKS